MEKLKSMYEDAMKVVCEVAELEQEKLYTSHEEVYVDGRAMLVNVLVGAGFTEKMISRYSKMSQQRINSLKNGFIQRGQKMSVSLCLDEVNRRLSVLTKK